MESRDPVPAVDRRLEAQGRRLGRPAPWFLVIAVLLAVPGVVLIVFAHSWAFALGVTLAALAGPPAAVGMALVASAGVARWSARHRPFA